MDHIFALDIGTRTVIGILGKKIADKFHILAQEIVEHDGRAMFDGQIHDIPRVAVAVERVRKNMENKVGKKLERVAIAAAGRSLSTIRCNVEQSINEVEIDENLIRSLELLAVHKAQEQLVQEGNRCYYVGHSVINYTLDGFSISNLLGHRARTIGVEALVTFLPVSVVDSLFSVLSRVNLQPLNLTLEPIAAVDVVVPEGLRMLNLALVDIGAGTSDIAITKEGAVVAYGMVPFAGDEISESIAESCLVDFNTAELIKRQIGDEKEITYTDILGNQESIPSDELMKFLSPILDKLANEIAAAILSLNGECPPKSVFLIGGGAQFPTLADRIASRLKISPQRVGLRKCEMLKDIVFPEDNLVPGPEGITVVGIATTALKNAGCTFINVKVNGRRQEVFNFPGLRVAHVLSHEDFTPRHLFAKNGRDLKFFVNGQQEVVLGELSRPAVMFLNGKSADLQTPVQEGDEIIFTPAQNGQDARAFVKNYLKPDMIVHINLNGKKVELKPVCYLNDLLINEAEVEISPDDRLFIKRSYTVKELAESQGFTWEACKVEVNGRKVPDDYLLAENDQVSMQLIRKEDNHIDYDKQKQRKGAIKIKVNGKVLFLNGYLNPIFLDVFNLIEIDVTKRTGNLSLKLNGKPANYTTPLKDNDEIEVST